MIVYVKYNQSVLFKITISPELFIYSKLPDLVFLRFSFLKVN